MPSLGPRPIYSDPSQACLDWLGLKFSHQNVPAYPYVASGDVNGATIPAFVSNLTRIGLTEGQAYGSMNVGLSEPGYGRVIMGTINNPFNQALLQVFGPQSYIAWLDTPAYAIRRDGSLIGTVGILGGDQMPSADTGPGTHAPVPANLTLDQQDSVDRKIPGRKAIVPFSRLTSDAANAKATQDSTLTGINEFDADFCALGFYDYINTAFTQEAIPRLTTDFLRRYGFYTAGFDALTNYAIAGSKDRGIPYGLGHLLEYGLSPDQAASLQAADYNNPLGPLPTLGRSAILAARTVNPLMANPNPPPPDPHNPAYFYAVQINPDWQSLAWSTYCVLLTTWFILSLGKEPDLGYSTNMNSEQDPNGPGGVTYDPIYSTVAAMGYSPSQIRDATKLNSQQKGIVRAAFALDPALQDELSDANVQNVLLGNSNFKACWS